MSKNKKLSSPATKLLQKHNIAFTAHEYTYEPHGGTACSSQALGVDEHMVIKTLVLENEHAEPCIVLMHGDCSVSTKELARVIGCKRIAPCTPETAQRHTGYQVGGTSPFATRKTLPVFIERSIMALPEIYINGGRRGFLVQIKPDALQTVLQAELVDVAT